jgi:Spy/CpxP family protein refolding chaperone
MARPIFWVCAALLFLGVPAAAAAAWCEAPHQQQPRAAQPPAGRGDKNDKPGEHDAQQQQRPKWWLDPKLRAELKITDQQSSLVDQIWQSSRPQLRDSWMQLEKLEATLAEMTQDDKVDETTVIAQIDKVEQMRAEANKRRTVMIYRMNKVLKPEQRAKVRALYERPQPGKHDGSR